ncbi:MAG TPA: hypothetical protein VHV83_20880, partial [Armatimonadota bacterium]|nr:hypothetical protein [Armatimonadota bacterium]
PKAAWGTMIAGSILSAFTLIVYETSGRTNFGQGLLKTQTYELADLPVLNPSIVPSRARHAFETAFTVIAERPPMMIYDEVRRHDRRMLDDAFLFALGFEDEDERHCLVNELHDAACRMIWSRQSKASNTRESRQTFDEWLQSGQPFGSVDEE